MADIQNESAMEYEEWLNQFQYYLKEYDADTDFTTELFRERENEIRFAYSKGIDPESAIFQLAKPYSEEKYRAKKQEIFKKYSSQHPRLYSLQHCMDILLRRLEGIHKYIERVRPDSPFLEKSTFQIAEGVTVQEEDHNGEISDDQTVECTRLVQVLAERLQATEEKILLCSILRSKYTVVCEMLSHLSGTPLIVLETGICRGEAIHWDNLSLATDPLFSRGTQLFLADYVEPVSLEELVEDLNKAQLKGDFQVIIISGLTYLHGNDKDDLFTKSCQLLNGFSEQFGVEVLILP